MNLTRNVYCTIYYGFAQYLPDSYTPIVGKISNAIRVFCCRHIFLYCGKNVSCINRRVFFGKGDEVEIGDYSGIGANCTLHPKVKIGKYVMMGPDVYIVGNNHITSDPNTPMFFQGKEQNRQTIIEDDCWIGARVMIMPGRKISKGSICASGAIIAKDVEPYSIWGGQSC